MLSKDRRALHRIPELDRQLPKTQAYLKAELEKLPCTLLFPWESSICAWFDFGYSSTVAFRSDMDGLPLTEQTGLPFSSGHPGIMHACGHDGHMAILLGLARSLAEHPEQATQNVLLIFQPAEETTGGARPLCESGLLEKYDVNRIYGLHLWPPLPEGVVACRAGGMMAMSCEINLDIIGKSSHMARWQEGADAVLAGSRFLQNAYAIAQQETCLLRFGTFHGGNVRNALSDHCRLEGTLRCHAEDVFQRLWTQLEALAVELQADSGCTFSLTRNTGYPPVTNDPTLLEAAKTRFSVVDTEPSYTTEDFSEYQKRVPGLFFLLGTGGEGLHSTSFNFKESVLETGLALFRSLL